MKNIEMEYSVDYAQYGSSHRSALFIMQNVFCVLALSILIIMDHLLYEKHLWKKKRIVMVFCTISFFLKILNKYA